MIPECYRSYITCPLPTALTRSLVPRCMLAVLAIWSRTGVFGSTFFVAGTGEAKDASGSLRGWTSSTIPCNGRFKRGNARSGTKGIVHVVLKKHVLNIEEKNGILTQTGTSPPRQRLCRYLRHPLLHEPLSWPFSVPGTSKAEPPF